MNIERMKMLLDHLKTVDEKSFYIGSWAKIDSKFIKKARTAEPLDNDQGSYLIPEGSCGTMACIGGHAALLPAFNDLGLRLTVRKDYWDQDVICIAYVDPETGKFFGDFWALTKFFGITRTEADTIFYGIDTLTAKYYDFDFDDDDVYSDEIPLSNVIKKLEQVVADGHTGI